MEKVLPTDGAGNVTALLRLHRSATYMLNFLFDVPLWIATFYKVTLLAPGTLRRHPSTGKAAFLESHIYITTRQNPYFFPILDDFKIVQNGEKMVDSNQ